MINSKHKNNTINRISLIRLLTLGLIGAFTMGGTGCAPEASSGERSMTADLSQSGSSPVVNRESRLSEGVRYHLDKPGQVSVAVYDAEDQLVRELLHAVPQAAGTHTLFWDGLDGEGEAVPEGEYTWRLLQTDGLQVQYLLSLGSNYPPGDTWRTASPPGTHGSPMGIAVDATGIYISAQTTENIETCMLKLTPDGSERLWSTLQPRPWDGAHALAVFGEELYMLGQVEPQRIFVYNNQTGAKLREFDLDWKGDPKERRVADLAVMPNGMLAVAYPAKNTVRWLDPESGEVRFETEIENPRALASGAEGQLYVASGDRIVRLSRDDSGPVTVVDGLERPSLLAVDTSTGEILVFVRGTHQVMRFSAEGDALHTYGEPGGRRPGIYNEVTKRSFDGVGRLIADNEGGFYISEPWSAPRRVAHVGRDGAVQREWYGGQRWAPHGEPEPGNPNVVWVGSHKGWVMRVLVDYDAGTWEVHSTYRYDNLAKGLVGDSWNEGGYFRIHEHEGTNYFVLEKTPTILKVDEENWQLVPVTIMGDVTNRSPDFIREWGEGQRSFQWNDANGDGIPQEEEFTFSAQSVGSRFQPIVDSNFTYFSFGMPRSPEPYLVHRLDVVEWNAAGAPIYEVVEDSVFTETPARFQAGRHQDGRWSAFLFSDPKTGDIYGGFNSWIAGWASSADSFMHRWDVDGESKWTVSGQGSKLGNIRRNIRGIAGVAHDCVIAFDFDGGWNMSNLALTYIWDRDGLFVGGIMDNPDLDGIAAHWYQLSGEFCHATVYTLPSGDVLFFGNWENEVRVYRVTGWDGWERQEGRILVDAAPVSHQGQGLTARYFEDVESTTPAAVRVDPAINFNWGQTVPEGSGIKDPESYVVSWRGTVLPEYGVAFDGPWSNRNQADAHEGRLRGARDDSSATLRFRGRSIRVVGSTGRNQGYLHVYLNGERVAEDVDTYSAEALQGVTLFEQNDLELGDHEVKVVVTGWRARRNPDARDSWVYLDKFVVDDTIEVDASGLEYQFVVETDGGVHLWLNDSLREARRPVAEGSSAEPVTTSIRWQHRHLPFQLDLTKAAESDGKVRLLWSTPFSELTPVPMEALYPVAHGEIHERPLFTPHDPGGMVRLHRDHVLDALNIRNPHDGPGGDFEQVFDLDGHTLEIDQLAVARRNTGGRNQLRLDLGEADATFRNGSIRVNRDLYVAGMEVPLSDGSSLAGKLRFEDVELDLTDLSRIVVAGFSANRRVEGLLDLEGARLVDGAIRVETLHVGRSDLTTGRVVLSEATGLRELAIRGGLEIGNHGGHGRIGLPDDGPLPDGVSILLGEGAEARASFEMASHNARLGRDSDGSLIAGQGGEFIAYLTSMIVGQRGGNQWGGRSLGTLDLRGMDQVRIDAATITIGKRLHAVQSGRTAQGEVYLPTGTVIAQNMTIGETSADGGLAEGLLDLSGTRVSISERLLLGTGQATHPDGLGRVVTRLSGRSGGLELAADAVVEVGERGRIELIFERPSDRRGALYYGLRWEGDQRRALQEMAQAEPARLVWDDAEAGGAVSIFFHEGSTYVGVRP